MDLVVDTSVIIAVVANKPIKKKLIARTVDADLFAPSSLHWEIGDALSAMLKRRRITLSQARQAAVAYQQIPLRFIDVDLEQALDLADRLKLYAYDAYIIACALDQRCPLLALDAGLTRAAQEIGIQVMEGLS